MDTTQTGVIGETKAITEYLQQGFEVFTQFSGKSPFDFVTYKDEGLRKITVKTTTQKGSSGGYIVDLRSIRPNRNGNKIKLLSNYDELVVYVIPYDAMYFFTPEEVGNRNTITIREEFSARTKPY